MATALLWTFDMVRVMLGSKTTNLTSIGTSLGRFHIVDIFGKVGTKILLQHLTIGEECSKNQGHVENQGPRWRWRLVTPRSELSFYIDGQVQAKTEAEGADLQKSPNIVTGKDMQNS